MSKSKKTAAQLENGIKNDSDDSRAINEKYENDFFDKLKATVKSCNAIGYTLIVGLKSEEEDEDENEDDEENEEEKDDGDTGDGEDNAKEKVHTKEQIDSLRYIIITKNRDAMLKKATRMATCGQAGDGMMCFNTQSGNVVIEGIASMIKSAKSKKTPALRFDTLLALTLAIHRNDCWAYDNEMAGEGSTYLIILATHLLVSHQ